MENNFLEQKFSDLHTSKEVESATRRKEKREKKPRLLNQQKR